MRSYNLTFYPNFFHSCEIRFARSCRKFHWTGFLLASAISFCYMMVMLPITIRKRTITKADLDSIQIAVNEHWNKGRTPISQILCQQWNWVQPNGSLCDMVARGYMLALYRAGYITLPPKKQNPSNPFLLRKKPDVIGIESLPVNTNLKTLLPLKFVQVRRTSSEALFNSLIQEYHYLGYTQPVGEHLKYLIYAKDKVVAAIAFSSAPRHIGPRDAFIGWDQHTRKQNIHLICYNIRFLILPWVSVKYLASHILSKVSKILSGDWEKLYNHRLYYIETFVDTERFLGTCYRAANWIYLGKTKGLGKDSMDKKVNRSIKDIYGYPLTKDFRKHLLRSAS